MKFFFSTLCLLSVSLIFSACGGEATPKEDAMTIDPTDYSDFQGKSLKEFGIPALIMLPDQSSNVGASVEPEIIHTEDDFKWEINLGPNFSLFIEDFGREKDLINREKKRLATFPFYEITYLQDSSDLIFYKRTLNYKNKKSTNVGVDHVSYHCYGVKEIDGIAYVFKSPDEGYYKPIIETMIKTIRSVEKN
jgi:hypothetical protein